MGKFDGILICTDLDGTLLKNDKTISEETLKKIRYFQSEGGYFTFITGRSPHAVGRLADKINPNCPYGCINGGGLYDHKRGEYVRISYLDEEFRGIAKLVEDKMDTIGYQVITKDGLYFCRENEAMAEYRRVTGEANTVRKLDEITERVVKIVFGDMDKRQLLNLERLVNLHPKKDRFNFVRSEETLLEMLPREVHKDKALKMLCEHLSLDIKNTVAVGDYTNDVEMIKTAGVGIAVENANEDAKKAADHITVSNENDAIAKVIDDIESGKILFGES
ncbi:MAG: HAD family phosphatase [Clostridia bacterium]|nr:HAD family phosphatase [Clostridia bacterium]